MSSCASFWSTGWPRMSIGSSGILFGASGGWWPGLRSHERPNDLRKARRSEQLDTNWMQRGRKGFSLPKSYSASFSGKSTLWWHRADCRAASRISVTMILVSSEDARLNFFLGDGLGRRCEPNVNYAFRIFVARRRERDGIAAVLHLLG